MRIEIIVSNEKEESYATEILNKIIFTLNIIIKDKC